MPLHTIQTTVVGPRESEQQQLIVPLPVGLASGTYQVVLILSDEGSLTSDELEDWSSANALSSLYDLGLRNFQPVSVGGWPDDLSLRREDMYDDSHHLATRR